MGGESRVQERLWTEIRAYIVFESRKTAQERSRRPIGAGDRPSREVTVRRELGRGRARAKPYANLHPPVCRWSPPHLAPARPPLLPLVMLGKSISVSLNDGRTIFGSLLCYNSSIDLILAKAIEKHQNGFSRKVGMVVVPGKLITQVHTSSSQNLNATV